MPLHARQQAYAYALPGHAPHTTCSVTSFDEAVDALTLEISTSHATHLVGYSLGARLCMGVLAKTPALLSGLVLMGGHCGLTCEQERLERENNDEKWARLLEEHGIDAFVAAWEKIPLWDSQQNLPKNILEKQRTCRRMHNAHALAACFRATSLARMPYFGTVLQNATLPVLLLTGELDKKYTRMAEEITASALRSSANSNSNISTHVIQHAGHNVVLEQPQEVARVVTDFWSKPEALCLQLPVLLR